MKNEKPQNIDQVTGFIQGVIACYELGNHEIDEALKVSFQVSRKAHSSAFNVKFDFLTAIEHYDNKESKEVVSSIVFTWLLSDRLNKLVQYVEEAIEEIDSFEFIENSETERRYDESF